MPAVSGEQRPVEPVSGHDDVPVGGLTPESEAVPEKLNFTSTPALLTALLLSIVLMMSALFGWYALGHDIRSQMTWAQGGTLLFFVLFMIAMMLSLGYSRLWADESGITVRNGPRVRRYRIDEVAGLRMRSGDAWAYLLVKVDGRAEKRAVLAIQHLEGDGAKRKLRQLRAWLKANGATSKDVEAPTED